MTERMLHLWLGERLIGTLTERDASWAFRYEPNWLVADDGFDLSPTLKRQADEIVDGGSSRPAQWFFDNLLPEEGARELLAIELNVDRADAFALLRAPGAESAGA